MAAKRWRLPLFNSGKPPKYAIVDEFDFMRLSGFKWRLHKNGYAFRFRGDSKQPPIFLHADVLEGAAGMIIDHINRQPLDCRTSNLRVITKNESQWNKGPYRNNTSGFKGVSYDPYRGTWQAAVAANGKRSNLGRYPTARTAAQAYDTAARALHGEYAYQNFPNAP